jgi:hypothetical protein
VLAIAAAIGVVAASAAPSQPEFYKGGSPLGEKVKVTFTTTGGAVTLEAVSNGGTVTCTGEVGSGEIEGPLHVKKVKTTYTGCSEAGAKCKTGTEPEGNVKTSTMEAEDLYLDTGHTKAGQLLKPITQPFAKFKCGTEEVEVRGEVIGEALPLEGGDKSEGTLVFAQEAGVQQWKAAEEKSEKKIIRAFSFLESGMGGGPKVTQPFTETVKFSEPVELHKS